MKFRYALYALLLAAGCSHSAGRLHAADAPKLDPGWKLLQSEDGTVTVAIPPTFHNALESEPLPQLDLGNDQTPPPPPPAEEGQAQAEEPQDQQADEATNRFIGDLNAMSSHMEAAMRKQTEDEMSKRGYVVWAWLNGKQALAEARTEISVKRIENSGFSSLDDAVSAARIDMFGEVQTQKASLPIGDAMEAKTDYQNKIGDEQTEIKYVLLDGSTEYILRLAATNDPSQVESVADEVADSLRVNPKS